ncbi:MAG TPA: hypothetical protein VFP00_04390, partial [Burkholderiales bacterium]|nr:hypothetical protein [Burkholderiales bacterium]
VAVSRALVVPVHLAELGRLELGPIAITALRSTSLLLLVVALGVGAFIILGAMLRGRRAVALQEPGVAARE